MQRGLPSVLFAGCLLGAGSQALAQGTIYMTSSGNADAVTIDMDITDSGAGPAGCNWLGVQRGDGGPIIAVIERQPGTMTHQQVVDTGLQPNTIYCYTVVLLQFPIPVPLYCGNDPTSICIAFDCFYEIRTCINTGPDPAYIGHGFLSSDGAVPNEVATFLQPCNPLGNLLGLYSVSGTAQQYVDSSIAVNVYGTMERGGIPQGLWYYVAQAATPQVCTVATARTAWGAVKSLYRE